MARKRKEFKIDPPKLDMMPMIDVVFQLLIFFVVSLKYEDILMRLNANRPSPDPKATQEDKKPTIDIIIDKLGFVVGERRLKLSELDQLIAKYARSSTTSTILIKCVGDSPHHLFMQALDICYKHDMRNISVFSL